MLYRNLSKRKLPVDSANSITPKALVNHNDASLPVLSTPCLKTPNLAGSYENEDFEMGSVSGSKVIPSQSKCTEDPTDDLQNQDPLQGLIAFVDVRSDHDNRSEGVAKVLQKLGAIVERKLIPGITHVIFSNGRQSTLKFVDKHDVFFVSVLWVDSCVQNHRRADESLYPASRSDIASPNRSKINRMKSMQPKAFEVEMKNSGKLEERRRKRNIVKEKKPDLPFDLISLEDMEMNEISKKIQENTSVINSPIASNSPFLDQVMRRLSEKRASLDGSPDCTKNDKMIWENVASKEEIQEGSKRHQNDNVFCKDSERLFEKERCVPSSESEVDKHNFGEFSPRKELKDHRRNSKGSGCNMPLKDQSEETEDKSYKQMEIVLVETDDGEIGIKSCKNVATKSSFSGGENNCRVINGGKKSKLRKKKLLSKNQVLSCSFDPENQAMVSPPVNALENVKRRVKLASKRKRMIEISSRKRRKGIMNETDSKRQETMENDIDQVCYNDLDKDERDDCIAETKGIQSFKTKKKANRKGSLVMTSMHYGQQEFVRNTVKKLGLFSLAKTVTSSTTHVVAGNGRRTLNILNAIAQGCWIVSPNWISDSYDQGEWLNEEDYELSDIFPSAKSNRCSKLETGKSILSSLFEKLDPIFVAENTLPPKFELLKLIRKCGGQVTSDAKTAQICIGDSSELEMHCKMVNEKWILDCVMKTALLDVDNYIIEEGNNSMTY